MQEEVGSRARGIVAITLFVEDVQGREAFPERSSAPVGGVRGR
jgi:hypothetical protein